ncbi:MAG: sel1 repeat family protein [Methanomassiliicoccaceae archaeon]|nr:sel1 repeat family protein [Methanomassiliicoccaceae archaeon]
MAKRNKQKDKSSRGYEKMIATVRDFECGLCGFKTSVAILSDKVVDDPDRTADTLIENGWSSTGKKLTCPCCTAEGVRLDARGGDVDAQLEMGWLCYKGMGVKKSYKKAARWFGLAAEQGEAYAQYNLGMMYKMGMGVCRDHAEAAKWFGLAAEQGDADAQYRLGGMWEKGKGVPQSDTEAMIWYKLAAKQMRKERAE